MVLGGTAGRMCTVPKPYPREFREDVIRVARNREPGVRIKDIAADFGISASCLQNWLTQADRDDGIRSGPTTDEQADLPRHALVVGLRQAQGPEGLQAWDTGARRPRPPPVPRRLT